MHNWNWKKWCWQPCTFLHTVETQSQREQERVKIKSDREDCISFPERGETRDLESWSGVFSTRVRLLIICFVLFHPTPLHAFIIHRVGRKDAKVSDSDHDRCSRFRWQIGLIVDCVRSFLATTTSSPLWWQGEERFSIALRGKGREKWVRCGSGWNSNQINSMWFWFGPRRVEPRCVVGTTSEEVNGKSTESPRGHLSLVWSAVRNQFMSNKWSVKFVLR